MSEGVVWEPKEGRCVERGEGGRERGALRTPPRKATNSASRATRAPGGGTKKGASCDPTMAPGRPGAPAASAPAARAMSLTPSTAAA